MPPLILDPYDEDGDEFGLSRYANAYSDTSSDFECVGDKKNSNDVGNASRRNARQRTSQTAQIFRNSHLEKDLQVGPSTLYSAASTAPGSQLYSRGQEPTVISDLKLRAESATSQLSHVRKPNFVYPKSRYDGYIPPLPRSRERHVVKEFLKDRENQEMRAKDWRPTKSLGGAEFVEFELTDFCIYLPEHVSYHTWEMRGLQNLATKASNSWYCFDGILSYGKVRRYVQCVPFQICSIGQYGSEFDTVGDEIWIQSEFNSKTDVFYRLKAPSQGYKRYHDGFLWLADLAKHFVDFAKSFTDRKAKIFIHNFRSDFAEWLEKTHGSSLAFRQWYAEYDSRDFRRAIATNIEFLWKEYLGTGSKASIHPLWSEVKDMDFIPEQPLKEGKTVVTPYVYDCFRHLKFGHHLKKVVLDKGVKTHRKSQGKAVHLTVDASLDDQVVESLKQYDVTVSALQDAATNKMRDRKLDRRSIAVGDVLGVMKDTKTSWKDEVSKWKTADACWWALVQGVHKNKDGKREFNVIWLYKPSDTSCAKMRYPYHDELFLSDNCNCGDGRLTEDEVLCKATVAWHGLPGKHGSDFFVRQTFRHDNSFVTLKESHKKCFHLKPDTKNPFQEAVEMYQVGDTVLIVPPSSLKSKHGLEPAEIASFIWQGNSGVISVRCLLRRLDVDKSIDKAKISRPNELVYTDKFVQVKAEQVVRKCLIRFYAEEELISRNIPAPYNRDGTGNAFYIITRLINAPDGGSNSLQQIGEDYPKSLIQGFDPKSEAQRERLRGLDLYCGGGNFGRGLEEGGAVRMTHAVDLARNAIHTYHANQQEPDSTKLFYGSVDDILSQVMHNNPSDSDLIPLPGMIDFLSAGSPCQGYSMLNSSRSNETGLKNQSLVASVAAYVDVYRPKYALLENVIAMAQKGRGRDEDVLSQLICCLVGLGYQIQLFLLDAWSCGSAQSRSRLFVAMAAPGLKLPEHPGLTHSHPAGTSTRGLGQGANGLSFGERKFEPTPFEFVTALEATIDLPDVGDGRDDHCTRHPDHRIPSGVNQLMKARIELIPRFPRAMSFVSTRAANLLTPSEVQVFPLVRKDGRPRECVGTTSRAWGRMHPQSLFPTIATVLRPMDARTGRALHWDQHRLLTVVEARRAQSFPDDEILTGNPSKQWKIVGNSVARTVALALGLSLRDAWLSNPLDEDVDSGYAAAIRFQDPLRSAIATEVGEQLRIHADENQSLAVMNTSTGEAALSDQRYHHSLDQEDLLFSTSKDDLASSQVTTPLTGEATTNGKKRQREQDSMPSQTLSAVKVAKLSSKTPQISRTNMQGEFNLPVIKGPRSNRHLPNIRERSPQSSSTQSEQKMRSSECSRVGLRGSTHQAQLSRTVPQQRRRTDSPDERNGVSSSGPSRNSIVINLISDNEGDAEESDDDVTMMEIRKKPKVYVPIDNAVFAAYERTYGVMRQTL